MCISSGIRESHNSVCNELCGAVLKGTGLMAVQSVPVIPLNRVSVVSCKENLSMIGAVGKIYQGKADLRSSSTKLMPSFKYFYTGASGHFAKELSRVWFKASGLFMKPRLEKYFEGSSLEKLKADISFAGLLSLAEMAINPADTLRTMWQAGKKFGDVPKGKKISHLYKGSSANGVRQFGTWYIFSRYNDRWSTALESHTSLDPHSISGIVAKALPQAFQITATVWGFERIKNEAQYHLTLTDQNKGVSRYVTAFEHIIASQGWSGLLRGFVPKALSNTVLVIGANYVIEQGRKAHNKQNKK